jgi:hypothetical protein
MKMYIYNFIKNHSVDLKPEIGTQHDGFVRLLSFLRKKRKLRIHRIFPPLLVSSTVYFCQFSLFDRERQVYNVLSTCKCSLFMDRPPLMPCHRRLLQIHKYCLNDVCAHLHSYTLLKSKLRFQDCCHIIVLLIVILIKSILFPSS